ncbi:MAG TPA: O-antigen ligase family protein [Stellaceae bacterium]|nr:O-antigen ligase family protein [Stellaceae bacterium]
MNGGRAFRPNPGHVLAATAFLLPVLAAVAPLAVAPLLGVVAIAALALGGYRDLNRLEPIRLLATLVILLGVVGVGSALWSVVPGHSLSVGLRFLLISAGGMVLLAVAYGIGERERDAVRRALFWGFTLALAALAVAGLVQRLGMPSGTVEEIKRWTAPFNRFDRSATTMALLLWPLMLALMEQQRRVAALLVLAATIPVLFSLNSRAAMLCLVVGLLLWPLARLLPRLAAGAIGAGVIALVSILPSLDLSMDVIAHIHQRMPWVQDSAIHRLAIWHFAIDRINERPLLGWGLDASRALPHGSDIIVDPRIPDLEHWAAPWMPLHPHNAALQWRLELGLPGATLASLIVLWLLWRIGTSRALPRFNQACTITLIGCSLVVAFISYGFWQEWWMSELWILAALMLAQTRTGPLSTPEP